MALSTYSDLKTSIASWLKRDDTASYVDDLIVLAEARIARDLRLRSQVTSTTLTASAGVQEIALPAGWLEFENLTITGNPDRVLNYVNIQHLDSKFPGNGYTGTPVVYSIEGGNLLLGPIPDAAYSLPTLYYKRLDPLPTTPTNWLLTNHPGIYLFGALAEAGVFVFDDQRAALFESKYQSEVQKLQTSDDAGQFSGSALTVKVI